MLFIFTSTLFFFAVFCGLGCGLLRITKWHLRGNPALVPFAGICIACLWFECVSLVLPLTVWTLLPLVCAGAAGIVIQLPHIGWILGDKSKRRGILLEAGFVIIVIFLLSYILYDDGYGIEATDTLGYHLSIVSWMNAAKVVPGLANLHFRLGMNTAYLQLAAGLDVGIFDKYSAYIMPFVFQVTFGLYCAYEVLRGTRRQQAFGIVMLSWLILCGEWRPGLYYDVPSMMFMAVAYYEALCRWASGDTAKASDADGDTVSSAGVIHTSPAVVLLFATLSFCIKQMGAVMLLVVFAYLLFDMRKARSLSVRSFFSVVALPAMFAVCYVVRNAVQTGYPLYPLPILPLGFKWTCPVDVVEDCYYSIKYYVRWPMAGYMTVRDNPFMYWFAPWVKREMSSPHLLFPLILLVSLILAGKCEQKKWKTMLPPC